MNQAPTSSAVDLAGKRLLFMGDSITDGNTYAGLVHQAFEDAERVPPTTFNAGIAGDTAKGMRARLDKDVLSLAPDWVTLSVGINDANKGVEPADYASDVEAIVTTLRDAGIGMLMLTTTTLPDPKHDAARERLGHYNATIRSLAERHGCRVAEVYAEFEAAQAKGQVVLDTDRVHPTYLGYQLMARAVLDGFGYGDLAVPEKARYRLLEGLVTHWELLPAPGDKPLTAEAVRELQPGIDWTPLELPLTTQRPSWWEDAERQRGMAVGLATEVAPAKRYIALTSLHEVGRRQMVLHLGANVYRVWLNGKSVYEDDSWRGWHPGHDRVPVMLENGDNQLVLETGGAFSVQVLQPEIR